MLARRSGGGGPGERRLRVLINGTPRAGPGRRDRVRATTPHPRQPGQEPPGQRDPVAEDRRPSDALAHRGPGRCRTRLQPSWAPSWSRRTWRPARRPVPGCRTPPHAGLASDTGSDDFRNRAWGGSGAWWCGRLAAVGPWSWSGRPGGRGGGDVHGRGGPPLNGCGGGPRTAERLAGPLNRSRRGSEPIPATRGAAGPAPPPRRPARPPSSGLGEPRRPRDQLPNHSLTRATIALSKASSEWWRAIQAEKEPPAASSICLRQASGSLSARVSMVAASPRSR